MIGYIVLAIIKVIDNIVGTAKNIAQYQERKFLSSVLVVVSQLLFYLLINKVIEDNSMLAIVIVAVASGVGNYLAFLINAKFRKDAKWVLLFTSSDVDKSKEFSNYLIKNGIRNVVSKGYDRAWENVISIIIFSKSKNESRIIAKYLEDSDFKYLLETM